MQTMYMCEWDVFSDLMLMWCMLSSLWVFSTRGVWPELWLEEKQRTCSWKAVRLFEEVMTAMEAYGVTAVAGKSIS